MWELIHGGLNFNAELKLLLYIAFITGMILID